MKKCVFILALLAVNFLGSSQSNFVQAVVINNNGDSIHGQIDYRNWKINPQTINFINAVNEKQAFDAASIKGFYIPGVQEIYTSFSVEIDMIPGDLDRALTVSLTHLSCIKGSFFFNL